MCAFAPAPPFAPEEGRGAFRAVERPTAFLDVSIANHPCLERPGMRTRRRQQTYGITNERLFSARRACRPDRFAGGRTTPWKFGTTGRESFRRPSHGIGRLLRCGVVVARDARFLCAISLEQRQPRSVTHALQSPVHVFYHSCGRCAQARKRCEVEFPRVLPTVPPFTERSQALDALSRG